MESYEHRKILWYDSIVTITALPSIYPRQHIVLHDVSWETYQRLRHDLENGATRLTYDCGVLEIMAPLSLHERWKGRIGRLIEAISEECDIEVDSFGSTTFEREDIEKGLEPDDCYYIQHLPDVKDKTDIDLAVDPPPDLAIEIDHTSTSVPRQPIYAALGVPELWRFDGEHLSVFKLKGGKYVLAKRSKSFPFLKMEEFEQFLLRMFGGEAQLAVLKEFRKWLRTL
jgi:Uma2 family endonuclease